MNYEDYSVDELEERSLRLKAEMEALRSERQIIAGVRNRKLTLDKLARKLGTDTAHLSDEEARALLAIANKPKPGDITVTPETAVLTAETH